MKTKIINISISILFLIISLYSIFVLKKLDVLPNKYFYLYIGIIVVLNLCGLFKNKILKAINYLLILLCSFFIIINGNNIDSILNKSFNNISVTSNNYKVIVLKDNKLNVLNELDNITLFSKDEKNDEVIKTLNIYNTNIKFNYNDDLYSLYEEMKSNNISSICIDEDNLSLIMDEYKIDSLYDEFKVIYEFSLKEKLEIEEETELKPINIYLSGSDSRSNNISLKSRTDVNMIITINPDTKTILLTSIPRDYYVSLYNKNGAKDKLTHSGIYGIDTSVKTIENLFDIKIDYYIKVGFGSVVKVVDLVGGVDIESEISFLSHSKDGGAKQVNVKEGINHFTGAEALSYARERYAYKSGDRHRILNQQQVLEAIINKISSDKTLLFNYNELLESLASLYKTNIPTSYIKAIVKETINGNGNWKIERISVSGSDASEVTYSMPSRKLYVMIPYQSDVKKAHDKILEIEGV